MAERGLGSLFFQHNSGFFGHLFFFAIGARNVAERGWLGDRPKFPKRPFPLCEGIGFSRSTHQRVLASHRGVVGVLRMIRNLNYDWLVRESPGLAEGSRRTEQECQEKKCKFHGPLL